jgi:hypothetical protein
MEVRIEVPCSYDAEVLDELPNTEVRYFYPKGARQSDGLIIRVVPHGGSAWTGLFAKGRLAYHAPSGVYSGPDHDDVCVVSRGQGYIVKASAPDVWEEIAASPLLEVRSMPEARLLIFRTPWELAAYGVSGLKWRTDRLSVEGLRILETTGSFVRVESDPGSGGEQEILIDLRTGKRM